MMCKSLKVLQMSTMDGVWVEQSDGTFAPLSRDVMEDNVEYAYELASGSSYSTLSSHLYDLEECKLLGYLTPDGFVPPL